MICIIWLLIVFLLWWWPVFASFDTDMQRRFHVLLDEWKRDDEQLYERRKRQLRLIVARRLADARFSHQHAVMQQFREFLDARVVSQPVSFLSDTRDTLCGSDDVTVDRQAIADAWLAKLNAERKRVWSPALELDARLTTTASAWACTLRERFAGRALRTLGQRGRYSFGSVHMRNQGDTYYHFPTIEVWMRERGVVARNIDSITFAEGVGAWMVRCPKDCTQAMIAALDQTWTMYMNEKPRRGVHYVQMTRSQFRAIGIGLAYDATTQAYRVVFHYATVVE